MTLTPENAFVGARVFFNREEYIVVKVNAKSVYLSKDKKFLTKWEEKPKGKTWKAFCSEHDAIMTKYDGIEISDKEVKAKENIVEDMAKKKKRYLAQSSMKEIEELWKRAVAKHNNKKAKSHLHIVETAKDKFSIVADNVERGMLLIHLVKKGQFVFYDVEQDEFMLFNKKEHKDGKDIIWPSRQGAEEKRA